MQELRLVAVSEDGTYLVLATAGRGTRFTLPVDDRLRAAVRGNFSRLGQYEIEVESPLRPKEIQARIRAGESAEEIAATAGIPVERVRWFEGPVLQEREYMAQQAQRVAVRLPGETTPGPTLGELVAERLTRRGVPADEIDWDSCKRDDNLWRVKLGFVWNGHTRHAEWLFDPRRRHITPNDDEAMRLSAAEYVEPVPVEDTTVRPFLPRLASKLAPVPPLPEGPLSVRAGRAEPDFPPVRPEPARRDDPVRDEPAARPAAETAYRPEAPTAPGRPVFRPEPSRETAFHLREPAQEAALPETETRPPVRVTEPAPVHGGAPPPSAPTPHLPDVGEAAYPTRPGDPVREPVAEETPRAEERLSLVPESAPHAPSGGIEAYAEAEAGTDTAVAADSPVGAAGAPGTSVRNAGAPAADDVPSAPAPPGRQDEATPSVAAAAEAIEVTTASDSPAPEGTTSEDTASEGTAVEAAASEDVADASVEATAPVSDRAPSDAPTVSEPAAATDAGSAPESEATAPAAQPPTPTVPPAERAESPGDAAATERVETPADAPAAAPAPAEGEPGTAKEAVAVPAARLSEERAAPPAAPAAASGTSPGKQGAAKEPKPEPPAPPTPKPAPARPRKSRGRRASVPTWDEIMFGARKQE
ncbi:septation protein SepH [Microtetraspora malaysiensis]|uniref:septation protein SepH n=1 Tax=Microtetraspora malaysiensis TaxID=161358 RepID=UPI000A046459|nr:septation protein SepH [Microtetraspora malaysiensis]